MIKVRYYNKKEKKRKKERYIIFKIQQLTV